MNWVESGYNTKFVPSIDRLDDYKPYTFDNIQLTTWVYNDNKHKSDRKLGVNNKINQGVIQYQLGEIINQFHSLMEAERQTGICHSNISKCINGKAGTAGGYSWEKISDE
jgi:hypothetical protein